MAWPKVIYEGVEYYQAQGLFLVPVDPSTGVAIIMLRKDGGIGAGFEAIEQGPPGMHAEIDQTINFTALAHDDPTPGSASWTELTPPDEDTPGLYRLNLALRLGEPGTDGASVLNPASFGTPVAKRLIVVKNDLSGFEFQAQLVGDRHLPVSINNFSGSGNGTLATIAVAANTYATAWRPELAGFALATGTDAQVDLVARLGGTGTGTGETDGNVIARCPGVAVPERLMFAAALPAGSNDAFDKVAANAAANIYIRVEKQGGSGSYAVANTACAFTMRARAIL